MTREQSHLHPYCSRIYGTAALPTAFPHAPRSPVWEGCKHRDAQGLLLVHHSVQQLPDGQSSWTCWVWFVDLPGRVPPKHPTVPGQAVGAAPTSVIWNCTSKVLLKERLGQCKANGHSQEPSANVQQREPCSVCTAK